MSLNARQKRSRKRKLAIALLATSRNPSTIASEGRVRSVWSKTMPPVDLSKPGTGKTSRYAPHMSSLGSSGQRGKSVKGHLVRPKGKSMTADGLVVRKLEDFENGPSPSDARRVSVAFPDTLRDKAAKLNLARSNKS